MPRHRPQTGPYHPATALRRGNPFPRYRLLSGLRRQRLRQALALRERPPPHLLQGPQRAPVRPRPAPRNTPDPNPNPAPGPHAPRPHAAPASALPERLCAGAPRGSAGGLAAGVFSRQPRRRSPTQEMPVDTRRAKAGEPSRTQLYVEGAGQAQRSRRGYIVRRNSPAKPAQPPPPPAADLPPAPARHRASAAAPGSAPDSPSARPQSRWRRGAANPTRYRATRPRAAIPA